MATLQELSQLRANPELLSRFVAAVEGSAATIFAEGAQVTDHLKRLEWAKKCLLTENRSQKYADVILKVAVQLNAPLQVAGVDVTDAAIVSIVNAYSHALAMMDL